MNNPYALKTLADVIAQVVQFAHSDYTPEPTPEDVQNTCAYTVACFLAQHTIHGGDGVGTDEGFDLLEVANAAMPYDKRLALAEKAIAIYGGQKP